jgi:hypothetical protein
MTKLQCPGGTKRKRCDWTSGINLRFVIGMPPHAIVSIPIKIEKATIELSRTTFIHLLKQRRKPDGPALAAMNHTAIAVRHRSICEKSRQSRHTVDLAVHPNLGLLPNNPFLTSIKPVSRSLRFQPANAMVPAHRSWVLPEANQ